MPLSKGRGREIGRRRMAFNDVQRSSVSRKLIDSTGQDAVYYLITLAVTLTPIQKGYLGYAGTGGLGYLADGQTENPAEFVYLEGGSQGDQVPIANYGVISSDQSLTTGSPVYLGQVGCPMASLPTTGIWQHVGSAVTDKTYIIEIDEYYEL